ncbi:MAG: IclR family transcriptional regulator [Gammaproteobacteria bacterium]|nr:MAG: IclR family transcriptional regulator [Gammaproteobacteria bacterium]RLA61713.1 MAG: IclR family transcriptional regulator [Gammaproteobacteria bacterium]
MSQQSKATGSEPRGKGKFAVKSAVRTLTLFEVFAQHRTPLSLSELARALDIPLSSCHGLVGTLQKEGYLYAIGERRRYYPTRRLFDLATAITSNDPTLELLLPHLEALRDRCDETVILGTRQGLAVLYLNVIEGNQTIRYSANTGDMKPLHSSAIGKALLGELEESELLPILNKIERPAITPNTLTEPDTLVADLEAGHRRGYFVTRGENVADVWAVARVAHVAGEALGVAIAGPARRMEENLAECVSLLTDCCVTIEAGFQGEV